MSERDAEVRRLFCARPKSTRLRVSLALLLGLAVYAWGWGDMQVDRLLSGKSGRNVTRFLGEIRPYPLRDREWDWGIAWGWAGKVLEKEGAEAVAGTIALSVASICLAGLLGILASCGAARNLCRAEPFLPAAQPPHWTVRAAWHALASATRLLLIFLRAIPEYVWAFLLVMLLGPEAWPAVLALALHNTGVLGKLDAEVIENSDPKAPRALRALGATRLQIAATALGPASLGRFLLYFFYRWETCVREATVLGLLGFLSLGWFIREARAAVRYDEMMLFVLLGSLIIIAGDLLSAVARRIVR